MTLADPLQTHKCYTTSAGPLQTY